MREVLFLHFQLKLTTLMQQPQRPPYGFDYQQYLNSQQQQQQQQQQQHALQLQQQHHHQSLHLLQQQSNSQALLFQQQHASSQQHPHLPYKEYKLIASGENKPHHVLKFHGRKKVDLNQFTPPVRLQRKQPETSSQFPTNQSPLPDPSSIANAASSSSDTKQTFTEDLKEKQGESSTNVPPSKPRSQIDTSVIAPFGGGAKNKQQLFKRRTKQIIEGDKESRALREKEGTPWVLEDFDAENVLVGNLQGGQRADYMLFILTDNGFKAVPASKWYKFTPKIKYATLSIDEAEARLSNVKSEADRWMMRKRATKEVGEEGEVTGETIQKDQLQLVDDGQEGAMTDEDVGKRRSSVIEGDLDELDFEEEFADDEAPEQEADEFDETKNKDEDKKTKGQLRGEELEDQEEEAPKLSNTGKEMRKLVRNHEKNDFYDSDDEKDPYASSGGEEDLLSEISEINSLLDGDKKQKDPAISQTGTKKKTLSSSGSGATTPSSSQPSTPTLSKKLKDDKNPSLSTSTSPPPQKTKRGAVSPASMDPCKKIKIKSSSEGAISLPAGNDDSLLTEEEIVQILKAGGVTTKELIGKVKRKLKTNPQNKGLLSAFVKKVAVSTKEGVLGLKNEYK